LQEDYLKPRYQRLIILQREEEYESALEDAKKIKETDPSFANIDKIIEQLE